MATSTAQAIATVPVYDWLMATGDPLNATPKGLPGKKVTIQLTYSLSQSASPVTLLGTDPVVLQTDPNGFWQANLVPNNKISPTGTLYKVEIEGYRSYLVNVTDVGAPAIGWQSSAIAVLPPVGGGAPGYTLPGGTSVLGGLTIAAGETGFDTNSPGALLIGDNVATSIELGVDTNVQGRFTVGTKIVVAPVPNGVDDTTVLQGLIAGGNVNLTLQQGNYLVSQILNVESNTTIQGVAIDATTLQIKSGSFVNFGFGYVFQCKNQIPTNANCHLRDLTLDGNNRSGGGAANQGGLCLPGNFWTMERVRFYDSSYFKLFMGSITNGRVKNCRFDGGSRGTDTIGGGGNVDCVVESCYFDATNDGNLLDFFGTDTGFIFRNNVSTLTNTFFLEGSTDALIEGNYLVGGIAILSNSRLAPTTNQNPIAVRVINNELNLAGLAGSSGIQLRYDDAAGATTHLAGGGNTIAGNTIRNPAKVGILVFGQADTWKTRGDVITGNKIFNPNSDATNTINTGFQIFNNTGIAIGIGSGDVVDGNSVTDDRGGGALMQYGYALGGSAATTLTNLAFGVVNTSKGHTIAMTVTTGQYTPLGPSVTSASGEFDVTTSGQNASVVITDLGGNGAGFRMVGAAGGKYARVHPGTADWEWLDSAHNNVIGALTDTGQLKAKLQMYPGAEAAGVQATGGFLHSTGVPSNANGNNNDWAISDNGRLYFKVAGAWITPSATLKKGSGGGNYVSASTVYVDVDAANLGLTITIPTNWKLVINASGQLTSATAIATVSVSLLDGATLIEAQVNPTVAGTAGAEDWALNWVINGDGASHTVKLQYKTSNGADSATILNSSATLLPTMVFTLMPSS